MKAYQVSDIFYNNVLHKCNSFWKRLQNQQKDVIYIQDFNLKGRTACPFFLRQSCSCVVNPWPTCKLLSLSVLITSNVPQHKVHKLHPIPKQFLAWKLRDERHRSRSGLHLDHPQIRTSCAALQERGKVQHKQRIRRTAAVLKFRKNSAVRSFWKTPRLRLRVVADASAPPPPPPPEWWWWWWWELPWPDADAAAAVEDLDLAAEAGLAWWPTGFCIPAEERRTRGVREGDGRRPPPLPDGRRRSPPLPFAPRRRLDLGLSRALCTAAMDFWGANWKETSGVSLTLAVERKAGKGERQSRRKRTGGEGKEAAGERTGGDSRIFRSLRLVW